MMSALPWIGLAILMGGLIGIVWFIAVYLGDKDLFDFDFDKD